MFDINVIIKFLLDLFKILLEKVNKKYIILCVIFITISFCLIYSIIIKTEKPFFFLRHGNIYHPFGVITIEAENDEAKKNADLIFKLDSLFIQGSTKPEKYNNKYIWKIALGEFDIPTPLRRDGIHAIEFGFSENNMSRVYNIFFRRIPTDTTIPYQKGNFHHNKIESKVSEPTIKLCIILQASLKSNKVTLSWFKISDKTDNQKSNYQILRNNQVLEYTSYNKLIDQTVTPCSTYQYQVILKSYNGDISVSNIETVIVPSYQFRQKQRRLTEPSVKKIIAYYDFYCIDSKLTKNYCNPDGVGIPNQFEVRVFMGDTVIIDHSTNLMWQKGGSEGWMIFEYVFDYLKNLNNQNYAGFNDWRLPTLEEAMSLMEPEVQNNMNIDSIFNSRHRFIWTTDVIEYSEHWVVSYRNGRCVHPASFNKEYVKAVRSIDDPY